MTNVLDPEWSEGSDGSKRSRIGREAGTKRIGASLYELSSGARPWPYHYQYANEEMMIVLSGRPHLRTPEGWRQLEPGEVVAFPRGPAGGHQVENRGDDPARYLMLSEMNAPEAVVYPDSDKVGVLSRPPGSAGDEEELAAWFRLGDQVHYWEGEAPPGEPEG
ncbi:MAG: cupin domain-containing protein [Actinobacteria bacterium]|nr:MAG: cupin domain-containing protein [Actinomycetota bacterium]